ncbi:MAG: hypothetical protein GY861_09720, partial [bacterium]|nr:hypothetical protein [bacterium]
MLTKFQNNGQISLEHWKQTILPQPFSGIVPLFYGSPKIHKIGRLTIRPIVSNMDIYCDKLLVHLKPVLNLLFREDYMVLNSYDLVNQLDSLDVSSQDRLASLDVDSLFTRVPVAQMLDIVWERLDQLQETEEGRQELASVTSLTTEAFMSLLQFVVQDFYFQWLRNS